MAPEQAAQDARQTILRKIKEMRSALEQTFAEEVAHKPFSNQQQQHLRDFARKILVDCTEKL
jgi:hypothetical protein